MDPHVSAIQSAKKKIKIHLQISLAFEFYSKGVCFVAVGETLAFAQVSHAIFQRTIKQKNFVEIFKSPTTYYVIWFPTTYCVCCVY